MACRDILGAWESEPGPALPLPLWALVLSSIIGSLPCYTRVRPMAGKPDTGDTNVGYVFLP